MTDACPGVGKKECGRPTKRDGWCGIHHPDRMAAMRQPRGGFRMLQLPRLLTAAEIAAIDAWIRRDELAELEREFWRLHEARSR